MSFDDRTTGWPASASFEPLSPTSYLDRALAGHGDRLAVVDGDLRLTYAELHDRCRRLAGALAGMADGRPVAVLAPNSHVMLEAHFGVPWAGVPLVTLNSRLSPSELAYIVEHSGAGTLVFDTELEDVAAPVATSVTGGLRLVRAGGPYDEYESLLREAAPAAKPVEDELALLSINYTSGTTGRPKGVMYHHRGAYLQALAQVGHAGLDTRAVFLWTLPMFHCNGWGFPWAVTAVGATHVCLRKIDPTQVWRLIETEGVTHFNGAPTVLSMLGYAPQARALPPGRALRVCTGGAPPTPALLARMEDLGIEITHLYGLTETFGPSLVCDWRPEWDAAPAAERAVLQARQGVPTFTTAGLRVIGPDGKDVPGDATTVGEIAVRGNTVMLGYYRDEEATRQAAGDGWFRTGDLAVRHPDGYIELRDRSKDVIISGGENIASIEVEQAIATHPAVLEVAVVAAPDPRWGEVPAAFITLHPDRTATEDEIIEHVRARLARFKAPRLVVFTELPRTSTGKIQKFVLRDRAREHVW